jgi:hypothetical protein
MYKKEFKLAFIGGGIHSTIGNIHYLASKLDSRWRLVSGFFSRDNQINIKSFNFLYVGRLKIEKGKIYE